jgi:hypothetical protein
MARTKIVLFDESCSVHTAFFQRNVKAVDDLLGRAKAGRRYLVIPITEDSWHADPLLERTMPAAGVNGLRVSATKWRVFPQGLCHSRLPPCATGFPTIQNIWSHSQADRDL